MGAKPPRVCDELVMHSQNYWSIDAPWDHETIRILFSINSLLHYTHLILYKQYTIEILQQIYMYDELTTHRDFVYWFHACNQRF